MLNCATRLGQQCVTPRNQTANAGSLTRAARPSPAARPGRRSTTCAWCSRRRWERRHRSVSCACGTPRRPEGRAFARRASWAPGLRLSSCRRRARVGVAVCWTTRLCASPPSSRSGGGVKAGSWRGRPGRGDPSKSRRQPPVTWGACSTAERIRCHGRSRSGAPGGTWGNLGGLLPSPPRPS